MGPEWTGRTPHTLGRAHLSCLQDAQAPQRRKQEATSARSAQRASESELDRSSAGRKPSRLPYATVTPESAP